MEEKVICKICGREFNSLSGHLKVKHGISCSEYREMFPGSRTCTVENSIKMSENSKIGWSNKENHIKKSVDASKWLKEKWKDPEYRAKRSKDQKEITRNQWRNNEKYRLKMKDVCKDVQRKQMQDSNYKKWLVERLQDPQLKNYTTSLGTSIRVRSSIEFGLWDFLERYGIDFEYESLWIPYRIKSSERHYRPDFYIPSKNLILECKAKYKIENGDLITIAKMVSSLNNGYNYEFITHDDLTDETLSSLISRYATT